MHLDIHVSACTREAVFLDSPLLWSMDTLSRGAIPFPWGPANAVIPTSLEQKPRELKV